MTLKEKTLLVWGGLAVVCVVGFFVVALVNAEVLVALGIAITSVLTFFATRIGALFSARTLPVDEPSPPEGDHE
jgi:hypothetical protein